MNDKALFSDLVGKVIVKIEMDFDDEITIETSDGNEYLIRHEQNCCETVHLDRWIGNVADILNEVITLAEDDHDDPDWADNREYGDDSHTWSAYYLETSKGRLELWFLGESNGCYVESMSFIKV